VYATAACLVPALAGAANATLARGPYLQRLTRNSVTVVWNTRTPAACSLAVRRANAAPRIVAGPTGTVCALAVGGLEADTEYHYLPRADGVPLTGESTFRTDGTSGRITFLVLGDSGCGCPTQLAVRDQMLASPADFIVHTGDMIYRKILRPEDFDQQIFAVYGPLMLGNHDRERDDGVIWRDAFFTPANNPAGAKDYYSFDYGNAHVAVIDSNASTGRKSPQYRFLDRDLAASRAAWKLVVFHHTIYSSGKHGGAARIRKNLTPLFDQHEVAAVFMGHDHSYERTKPLRDGRVVGAGEGTTYVTTGGGGKSIRPVGTSGFTAYSESAFHFTRVTVDRDQLRLEMVRADGVVRDDCLLPRRGS
jgi:predicted phosphodiesterase